MLSTCVESHVEWCRTPGMDAGPGAVHQGWFAKRDSERNQRGMAFSVGYFLLATQEKVTRSRKRVKALCRRAATALAEQAGSGFSWQVSVVATSPSSPALLPQAGEGGKAQAVKVQWHRAAMTLAEQAGSGSSSPVRRIRKFLRRSSPRRRVPCGDPTYVLRDFVTSSDDLDTLQIDALRPAASAHPTIPASIERNRSLALIPGPSPAGGRRERSAEAWRRSALIRPRQQSSNSHHLSDMTAGCARPGQLQNSLGEFECCEPLTIT